VGQLGCRWAQAELMLIADLTAIIDREVLPLSDKNYQFPNGVESRRPKAGRRTAVSKALGVSRGRPDAAAHRALADAASPQDHDPAARRRRTRQEATTN